MRTHLASIVALAAAITFSLPVAAAEVSEATLVSDIRPDGSSDPLQLTHVGEHVFLTATDGTHGRELWVTDGSSDGTRLVKDIRPGSASSAPQALTRVGSRLFFTANDGGHGRELWVSDGTAAGTRLVKDLTAGPRGEAENGIVALGDVALFSPGDRDLYRTDGTTKGTRLVRSFLAVNLDDTAMKSRALVFPADDAVWKTDGSSAGTRRISPRDIQAHDLTSFRGRVWFTEFGYPDIGRLWRSDGTSAGTRVVPDVYAPSDLTVMGDTLYLDASVSGSATKAPRLFRSDGRLAGTNPVQPRVRPLVGMVKGAGRLWMARMSEPMSLPDELWVSDGSATGTTLVMGGAGDWVIGDEVDADFDDAVGMSGSMWFSAGPATDIEGELVLTDTELWRSDGTTAGTTEAADIDPDGSSMPRGFVKLGDAILFSATDGVHGRELWRFDP